MPAANNGLYGGLQVAGGLGMATFFGCLLIYDEVGQAPAWLVWPALVAMLGGVFGGLFLAWRRGELQTRTVVGVLLVAVAAFLAARFV